MKKITAGLLLVLSLAGCSSTPSPSQQTESYDTVTELGDAFEDAGGDCSDFDQTDQILLAKESALCSPSTLISIYASESDRDQMITSLKNSLGDTPPHLLVGKNWVINTENPEKYVDELGGKVVTK
jgi:hypothetical protein